MIKMEQEKNYKSRSLFGKKTGNLRLSFNLTGLSEEVLPVKNYIKKVDLFAYE